MEKKKTKLTLEKKYNLTGWAFLLPAAILIFVFCFYPMAQAILLSFRKTGGVFTGLSNYTRVFRTLHRADILRQCIISTPFPEEFGINLIVSIIQSPLMQGKRSHRTLISDVENNAVVGRHTISKPFQFGSLREFWTAHHQIFTLRILAQIMLIEIVDGRICKCQGTLVCTIDIAKISTVG